MPVKLVWRVEPAPTGRYRSFQHRGWPTAYYKGDAEQPAAFLTCEDEYTPPRAREGQHQPITITLLHHNDSKSKPWGRYRMKAQAETLDAAKATVQRFLDEHPSWHPSKVESPLSSEKSQK